MFRHCNEVAVLGFDCEWMVKPDIGRQKVALLQLASHRGLCVLIRLSTLKHIPDELKVIMRRANMKLKHMKHHFVIFL